MPSVGETARRTRRVTARDVEPITRLRTTIVNQDGTVVLDGRAVVWTEPV